MYIYDSTSGEANEVERPGSSGSPALLSPDRLLRFATVFNSEFGSPGPGPLLNILVTLTVIISVSSFNPSV